jgi:type I restriction enzyme S subunit
MKHSGVEWIGEIPNHWDIRALRHLGNFKSGSGFPDAEQGRYGEEIGFYKVGDLQYADDEGSMRDASHTVSPATARRLGATVFQTGTIVFAKVGAALMLNRYRVLSRPSCLDNNMMAFSLDWDVIEIEYALSLMPLLDLKRIVNPGALPSVNASQMKEEIAPVPPLAEQLQISRFISEQRRASRLLRARCETAISLTRERRSALITAAVTGQIDVSTYKSDRQAEAVA